MEACNLGSVNLAKFVVESASGPAVDYPRLKEAISWSVRFLDNTIDMSRYPLPEITEMVRGNRKIGLGVMGFADMLFQMGIPYNSEEALQAAEEVMHFVQEACHETSETLAQERGVFANWDRSIFKDKGLQRRNATTTTIAPTGTLSIIAGCSSGIEPLFALSFVRTVMDNDKLMEVNPVFEKAARERGFYRPELMDQVARKGSIHEIEEIPEEVRRVFVTAHDVSSEWHIRMQAAFQKHTDNAVSKTVNLPRDATVGDVRKVYDLAYAAALQGGHDLPRRQQGEPGPLLRPEERRGGAAHGGRSGPARDLVWIHHQDQDRVRPPVCHRDRIRGPALRGVCHHR